MVINMACRGIGGMTMIAARFVPKPHPTILPLHLLRFCQPSPQRSVSMATATAATMETMPIAAQATSFDALKGKVDPALLAALKHMKFDNMSPVQEKVMATLPGMGSDW